MSASSSSSSSSFVYTNNKIEKKGGPEADARHRAEIAKQIANLPDDVWLISTDGSSKPNPGKGGAGASVWIPPAGGVDCTGRARLLSLLARGDFTNSHFVNDDNQLIENKEKKAFGAAEEKVIGQVVDRYRSLGPGHTNNTGELHAMSLGIDVAFGSCPAYVSSPVQMPSPSLPLPPALDALKPVASKSTQTTTTTPGASWSDPPCRHVCIVSDSELAVKAVRDTKRGVAANRELVAYVRHKVARVHSLGINVQILWCKGHAGMLFNDRADALSSFAAEQPKASTQYPPRVTSH